MKLSHVTLSSLIVVGALTILTADVTQAYPVDDSVTVVTTNGDTLVAHRYEVQERFQNLKLWVGNKTVTVDRADVVSIRTSTEDITQQVHDLFDGKPTAEEMVEQERKREEDRMREEERKREEQRKREKERQDRLAQEEKAKLQESREPSPPTPISPKRAFLSLRANLGGKHVGVPQWSEGGGGSILLHAPAGSLIAFSFFVTHVNFFEFGDHATGGSIGLSVFSAPRLSGPGLLYHAGGGVGLIGSNRATRGYGHDYYSARKSDVANSAMFTLNAGIAPMIGRTVGLELSATMIYMPDAESGSGSESGVIATGGIGMLLRL